MRGGVQGIQWGEEVGGGHTLDLLFGFTSQLSHTLDGPWTSRCASQCLSWRRNDHSTCCYEDKERSHLLKATLPFKAQVHPSHTPSKKPV